MPGDSVRGYFRVPGAALRACDSLEGEHERLCFIVCEDVARGVSCNIAAEAKEALCMCSHELIVPFMSR